MVNFKDFFFKLDKSYFKLTFADDSFSNKVVQTLHQKSSKLVQKNEISEKWDFDA
jgi:hypothetical protein